MDINNFEKKLSIIIKLFKNIDVEKQSFSEPYDKISIKNNEKVNLKATTFYHNIENQIFYLVYFLFDEKNKCIPLGDSQILNLNLLKEKYKTMEKDTPSERGLISGVWGMINANIDNNLSTGNYEICIFAKKLPDTIANLNELEKSILNEKHHILNEESRENYLKENNYYIASSAPLYLERIE